MEADLSDEIAAMRHATTRAERDEQIRRMNEKVYEEWANLAPAFFERIEARFVELNEMEAYSMTECLNVRYVIEAMKAKRSLSSYDTALLAELLHDSHYWVVTGEDDPEEANFPEARNPYARKRTS